MYAWLGDSRQKVGSRLTFFVVFSRGGNAGDWPAWSCSVGAGLVPQIATSVSFVGMLGHGPALQLLTFAEDLQLFPWRQCLCKGQEEGSKIGGKSCNPLWLHAGTSDSVSDHDPDSSNTTNFLLETQGRY